MKTFKQLLNEVKQEKLPMNVKIRNDRGPASADFPTRKDVIAQILQTKVRESDFQTVFKADAVDRKLFKVGGDFTLVRIATPLTNPKDLSNSSIARIDLKTARLSFIDNDHFEKTDEVKWERFFKFKQLIISNPKEFGIN